MTAEPVAEPTSASGRRWPVPPRDGYTVDDLFTLPDLCVVRAQAVVDDLATSSTRCPGRTP